MRDTDLYRQLLGLVDPWTVDRVELDAKQQRAEVWAKHDNPLAIDPDRAIAINRAKSIEFLPTRSIRTQRKFGPSHVRVTA